VAGLGLLLLATVLLSVGADLFTAHATELAHRWRVHPIAIGLLLAGAELEELVTAINAVHRHHPQLAAGDIIGANVTMLTLIVGVAALFGSLKLVAIRPYMGAALATSVAAAVAVFDGRVSTAEGVLLFGAFVVFVALVLRHEHTNEAEHDGVRARHLGGLVALAGLGTVVAGGWLAVTGAERVVEAFDIREGAVGLTLLALATSGELFALLWASRRHGLSELALAAIAGSITANATATLGITAIVASPLRTGPVRASALLGCVAGALLLLLPLTSPARTRVAGVLFVGMYVCYVLFALR
jgi:cation:H+ antiporter